MWIVIAPPMGEDRRQLAGDCVAVCSCCPCLVVQILVLLVVGVPRRLARNSRELVRRKLGGGGRRSAAGEGAATGGDLADVAMWLSDGDVLGGGGATAACRGCAIAEAEEVMAELHRRGEFGFGSFWRRRTGGDDAGAPPWKSGCAAGRVVEVRLA
ncbi:unnamed protein product [Spirodela intermedia]|uniref:Uncharacterized protein n=1 Tax=Spirodela intermedia TaxID=51605 RepID=A0A7I8KXI8_SPIIN|nr:unnamed protein product [Spirodela intermedia]